MCVRESEMCVCEESEMCVCVRDLTSGRKYGWRVEWFGGGCVLKPT